MLEKAKKKFYDIIKHKWTSEQSLLNKTSFPLTWTSEHRTHPITAIPQLIEQSKARFPTDKAFDAFLESQGHWLDVPEEEDDSWLHIDPKELEAELMKRLGSQFHRPSSSMDLDEIVESTETLLTKGKSGYDGIERPTIDTMSAKDSDSDSSDSSWEDESEDPGDEEYEAMRREWSEYMGHLDAELNGSLATHGFECHKEGDVDVEANLAANFLKSFSAQNGFAGPVSTLLGSMGFHLDRDEDSS